MEDQKSVIEKTSLINEYPYEIMPRRLDRYEQKDIQK
jgi:hypothetical protein